MAVALNGIFPAASGHNRGEAAAARAKIFSLLLRQERKERNEP